MSNQQRPPGGPPQQPPRGPAGMVGAQKQGGPRGQTPMAMPQQNFQHPQQHFVPNGANFIPQQMGSQGMFRPPQYQQQYYGGGAPRPVFNQMYPQGQFMVQPTPPVMFTQQHPAAKTGAVAGSPVEGGVSTPAPSKAAAPTRKRTAIKIVNPNTSKEVKVEKAPEPEKPAAPQAAAATSAPAPATVTPVPAVQAAKIEPAPSGVMTPNSERRAKVALKITKPPPKIGDGADKPAEAPAPVRAEAPAPAPAPTTTTAPLRAKDKKKAALEKARQMEASGTGGSQLDAYTDETRQKLEVTKKESKPNVIPSGKAVQQEENDTPTVADDWEDSSPDSTPSSGDYPPTDGKQWTPTNTSGQKRYPLNFMMAFRPRCAAPPDDFRKDIMELMSSGQGRQGGRGPAPGGNFKQMPSWMAPQQSGAAGGGAGGFSRPAGAGQGGNNGPPPKRQSGHGRPPRNGSSGGGGGKKVITLNRAPAGAGNEGSLKKADHAWGGGKTAAAGSEKSPVQSAIGILNKLTLEKFDALSIKLIQIILANMDMLDEFVSEVFSKAIDEEFFAMIYAKLCRKMADAKKPGEDTAAIEGFKKILLNKCQAEFEVAAKADGEADAKAKVDATKKAAEESDTTTKEPTKAEAKAKREAEREAGYARNKVKRHMLGNIKFIGELFKEDMVTERIMRHCIKFMMPDKNADEENMENLCKLLETAGGKLEAAVERKKKAGDIKDLQKTFQLMHEISDRKGLSSRIKFYVKDILEMRSRRWKQRSTKADTGPKLISDVHREAQLEQAAIQDKNRGGGGGGGGGGAPQGRRSGGGRDYQGGGGGNRNGNGWNTVPVNRPERVDASRFNSSGLGGIGKGSTGMSLGGIGGGIKLGLGSLGRKPAARQAGEVDASGRYVKSKVGNNAFAALQKLSSSGSPAASEKKMGSPLLGQKHLSLKEKSALLKKGNSLRASPPPADAPPAVTKPAAPAAPPCKFSREQLENKIKGALTEFISIEDLNEIKLSLEEWGHPDATQQFVEAALNLAVEAKAADRGKLIKMFFGLVAKDKGVAPAVYVKALSAFLELVPDLQYDSPKVTEYLAQFVAVGLACSSEVLAFFNELQSAETQDLLGGDAGLKIALLAFKEIKKKAGAAKMSSTFAEFATSLETLLPANRQNDGTVKDLCERYEVAELLVAPSAGKTEAPASSIAALLAKDSANDPVFSWIDENVSETDRKLPSFIDSLAGAVVTEIVKQTTCPSAADAGRRPSEEQKEQETEAAKKRLPLLIKYTDNSAELQLHLVCAVQAAVHKLGNPQMMVERWFDYLYDEDVVPEEVFLAWEKDEDCSKRPEYPGKNSALIGAKQLLERLKNGDVEDDPDAPKA